jgi:hypothetical protein
VKIAITATMLLAVLMLAACGGSKSASQGASRSTNTAASPISKAAYIIELQRVGTSLVTALNSFGKKFSSFKKIEASVGRGQAALRQAAQRLAATTPPAAARADNAKLVSGMRYFAAQLAKLRAAASQQSLKSVIAADRSLDRSPAVQEMMAAAADLQAKGYKLGQLAPSSKD